MPSAWANSPLEGFGLPDPPAPLGAAIRSLGQGVWGTRPGTPALRGLDWFLEEAAAEEPVDDYVLADVEDVSTGVPAVHFLIVAGPLWLAAQGRLEPGTEGPVTTAEGRQILWGATELVMRAPSELERLGAGRLVVTDTVFSRSEWHWSGLPPSDGAPGVAGAVAWLDQLGG